MGQAVAERTILRPKLPKSWRSAFDDEIKLDPKDKHYFAWLRAAHYSGIDIVPTPGAPSLGAPEVEWETWGDVAKRVAMGNSLLAPDERDQFSEYVTLGDHIARATVLLSGRHLQHGDASQPGRNQEVFTNCSTAASSALLFYLLLNGSGVGRSYDDDLMLTDWDHAPELRCVLSSSHKDFQWGTHEDVRDAKHKYGSGPNVIWHEVDDSREGWAKAVELFEVLAFQRVHAHKLLVLDFSKVRPKGAPIHGMQLRPASGPIPLMSALANVATIKGAGLPRWRQALYADHYLAECVLVGGARRAARMSTKSWRDKDVVDFIQVKRPIEYADLSMAEVIELRKERAASGLPKFEAFLWSSNNSITVDGDFWRLKDADPKSLSQAEGKLALHARKVWGAATRCAYGDGTGEPGFVNVDKLDQRREGLEGLELEVFAGFDKFMPSDEARVYLSLIAKAAKSKQNFMIVNPCGEVALFVLGGYCVISDVVPFHADDLDDAEDAFRAATRALMRVNLLPSLYQREVRRTNRIGVGMTGVHEFAWRFFHVGFDALTSMDRDEIVDRWRATVALFPMLRPNGLIEELRRSEDAKDRVVAFWMTLSRFSSAVKTEAADYAGRLGVAVPHTNTTIKPAGTTSKLFGLTEGWHLPPMAEYLRWVQFRHDDPLLDDYRAKGYPTRELVTYKGTVIVGFPTRPTIADLGMGSELVLAPDASMARQYRWLELGEFFYIRGVDAEGEPIREDTGNQISYTLKYDPEAVSYDEFVAAITAFQPGIKCCSVMPAEDTSAFEYMPEQAVTKAEYEEIVRAISGAMAEDVDGAHVGCASGACPVDFNK
jgi:hypothetical protein